MPYRFRPPLWSIAATALCLALFLTLGVWQLQRGLAKAALHDAFRHAATQTALELHGDTPPPEHLATPFARAQGRYDGARQLLLDNQSRDNVPGYHAWTPLRLDDGAWLFVDRGWIAADPDRRKLPVLDVASDDREVRGWWRPLPSPGLRLDDGACTREGFPRVVSYPRHEELACILGGAVADGVLLLDPAEAEGYVREWTLPNPLPPSRHYGYAAQWFAFAATLLFFFIKLNLRRDP